jgi:hypothetical protein
VTERSVLGEQALERLEEVLDDEAKESIRRQTGYCRLMDGATEWNVRRTIQEGFNDPRGYPRVLIAQSRGGREGLNLDKACRILVQFHPEWNPGVVEQQIGRVDRLDSHWSQRFEAWRRHRRGEPPRIEVLQVVFEGTYDAQQRELLARRTKDFDAALFGSLLDAAAWEKVPEHLKAQLRASAPDFDPARMR